MNPLTENPPTVAIRRKFHIGTGRTGHRVVRDTAPPAPGHSTAALIPRLSRLMPLALRFEQLIRHGTPTTKPTSPASATSAAPA